MQFFLSETNFINKLSLNKYIKFLNDFFLDFFTLTIQILYKYHLKSCRVFYNHRCIKLIFYSNVILNIHRSTMNLKYYLESVQFVERSLFLPWLIILFDIQQYWLLIFGRYIKKRLGYTWNFINPLLVRIWITCVYNKVIMFLLLKCEKKTLFGKSILLTEDDVFWKSLVGLRWSLRKVARNKWNCGVGR